ncbi:hypothetical protein [Streptomyces sp. NPDC057686]|uniref:hypothetical protein n=1 Tax=Streptomyces sp. NPDC057686 TaxID=3346212 RepID=UPI0036B2E965
MSTPEEQQHQQRRQDPYGTQTWQSDTWDTGYQPVQPVQPVQEVQEVQEVQPAQPPLGALPGQPVAPEGWFRDEAPAAAAAAQAPEGWSQTGAGAPWPDGSGAVAEHAAYLPPYPGPGAADPQPQPVAPEGWFRDEAPAAEPAAQAPAAEWPPNGGQGASWAEGSAAEQTAYLPPQAAAAAEQTAYLPPYPGPEASAADQTAYLPPYPGPHAADPQPQAQPVAPEGWFRDEAPAAQAPAPAAGWAPGGGSGSAWGEGSAAEQTAYLPPQAAAAPAGDAAEQTAFLPPYPGPGAGPEEPAAAAEPAPEAQPAAPGGAVAPLGSEVPGEEPAYSPPTLAGNTLRAVDPAQARAEGRSPVIDPGPQPAILTAALGLLLAGAAAVGELALLVPLIALQGLTAAGWFRLNGMWPARQGIALAFLGALVADGAVLAVDDAYGPGAIIGTLGAWVLLTLVLQLRSHADPDERMYGLMASVASAALAIVCAGYLAADSAAVSVGAAAVAVAVFTRALPLPTPASVGVSLAAATGAGIAVGGLTSVGVGGALVGLAAGVCALIGLRVAAYDYPSKFVHMTAGVALPLAAAAPAVYLIGRVVG